MSATAKPRERFHLPTLILDPRLLRARADDLATVVFTDTKSSAPIRTLLERRSRYDFIEDLHQALQADGLSAELASDALDHVVNRPSLAVRRTDRDERRAEVLQAVALEDPGGAGLVRAVVVVTATIVGSKPPEVNVATAELLPIDWENIEDRNALCVQMEHWWREYGLRTIAQPYEDAPEAYAWLGAVDTRSSYRAIPPDWQSQLRATGAVLGLDTRIAGTPHEAAAQALHDQVDFAVALNGAAGWEETRQRMEEFDRDVLTIGTRGTDFASLLAEVRRELIGYVLDCVRSGPSEPRLLQSGEVVYHRKVSPQPRKFDRFDAGSSQPCRHGAGAFVRWSGDKALKGMQRLYPNFEAKMLYHCDQYPKCRMYAAKG